MAHDALRAPEAVWDDRDTFDLFDGDRDGRLSADEILLGPAVTAQPLTMPAARALRGVRARLPAGVRFAGRGPGMGGPSRSTAGRERS